MKSLTCWIANQECRKTEGIRAKLAKPLCMPLTFVELGELLAEFAGPASVVSHSWEALIHILQHFCQEIDRLSLCNIPLPVYLLPCVSMFPRLECFHHRDIFRTKLLLTSLLNRALLVPSAAVKGWGLAGRFCHEFARASGLGPPGRAELCIGPLFTSPRG